MAGPRDAAVLGYCELGYFRLGMNKVAADNWRMLRSQFEGVATCDVTRRRLYLGTRDSVTGHRSKNYSETTIEGILIPRVASHLATQAGTYVKLDALFITVDPLSLGDEIYANGVYYEVKAVKDKYVGDSFFHREADLTKLSLHE